MNQELFLFLNGLAGHSLLFDTAVIFSAINLPEIIFISVGLYLFWHWYRHDRGILARIAPLLATALLAWILGQALKYLIGSPRPFLVLDDIPLLFTQGGYDSFPSGHATFFFALGTALFFQNKKFGILLFAGAVIMGAARIIVGVHWPIDILGGFVLGSGVVSAFYYCRKACSIRL